MDKVQEKQDEADQLAVQLGQSPRAVTGASFMELLDPRLESRNTASLGFLHVLSLGSLGLLSVAQAADFGDILLRVPVV